jgi:hypothetical protein
VVCCLLEMHLKVEERHDHYRFLLFTLCQVMAGCGCGSCRGAGGEGLCTFVCYYFKSYSASIQQLVEILMFIFIKGKSWRDEIFENNT